MAHAYSMSDKNYDDIVALDLKLTIPPKEADTALAVAKAYFAKFGLTDEKIIRQFTLYSNQFRPESDQRENELLSEAENFRSQTDFIKYVDANSSPTKINIAVKKWFMIRIQAFGMTLDVPGTLFKVGYLRYM